MERGEADIDELMRAGPGNLEPSESQLERIQTRMVEDLRPVRPLPSFRFLLFACATGFLCIVTIGAIPFALTGWDALSVAQRIAIFTTLAASLMLLAVSMVGQMAPGSKFALAPARLPIAVLTALLLVIAAAFRPAAERAFVTSGVTCLRTGLTFSIPAAILFGLIVRRGAMLSPKLIGATAGALSGLAGLTVLEVNCSNLNVFHILVWHWGVILIGPGCGALFGAAVEHIERRRLD